MRILVVSPYLPSRRSGGPVRVRGLLRSLSAEHAVTLLAYESVAAEHVASVEEARAFCGEVVTVRDEAIGLGGAPKRALQMRSLVSRGSFARVVYHRPAFQAALDRLLQRRSFDVIQVEHSWMMPFDFPSDTPIVLDEHNIEYDILRRTAAVGGTLPRKLYNYVDYLKQRAEEQRYWRRVDACALTSARDEALLRGVVPDVRTAVVPNGADTEFFSPRDQAPEPGTLLFFGTINYYPNTDGLLFFLREVMPLLRRSHPRVKLVVVGSSPPPAIRRWASPDVVITGSVDDVRQYLARAQVVIAPLRIGGGTRLKILEAMAMGRPVVSTPLGAEGLAVTGGTDILIGDGAPAFAVQVGRLLDDDALAQRIGSAGRRLVEQSYDWRAAAQKLLALYRSVRHAKQASALATGARVAPEPGTNSSSATP
jgi:glycosyltransferase involved in cell wall biosynthesis